MFDAWEYISWLAVTMLSYTIKWGLTRMALYSALYKPIFAMGIHLKLTVKFFIHLAASVAVYKVWYDGGSSWLGETIALILYTILIYGSIIWEVVFYYHVRPALACLCEIGVVILSWLVCGYFFNVSWWAGLLMIPYAIFYSYILVINLWIIYIIDNQKILYHYRAANSFLLHCVSRGPDYSKFSYNKSHSHKSVKNKFGKQPLTGNTRKYYYSINGNSAAVLRNNRNKTDISDTINHNILLNKVKTINKN